MMPSKGKEQIDDVIRRAWGIWAILFGSLAAYVVACRVMADSLKGFAIQEFPLAWVRNILLVVSAIIFVMTGNIRKFQLHGKSIAQRIAKMEKSEIESNPVLLKYMSVILISLVLSEIIAVFGVIIFLLSRDFPSLYIFTAFSAVAMLVHCPQRKEVKKIAEKMGA